MKTDIPISEVMKYGVITIDGSKTVVDAAKSLKKHNIGCIIVTEKGKARGVITERDIIQKVTCFGKDAKRIKVSQIMSTPLRVIREKDSVQAAAEAMKVYNVKRLPVVNAAGQLTGIITETDMVKVLPGMIDIMLEKKDLDRFKPEHEFTGVCAECGLYSHDLKRNGEKLYCDECIEEQEV